MATDSGVFRDATWLASNGYRKDGRGWAHPASGQAYTPLYEAKMVHQFDHRWATYEGATEIDYIEDDEGSEKADLKPRDVSADQKIDCNFEVEARYFILMWTLNINLINLVGREIGLLGGVIFVAPPMREH